MSSYERRLILVRHGQTEYNRTGRMQGHLDTDLSDIGREQARIMATATKHWNVSRLISSDLRRARDTAAELATQWDIPVEIDVRLRETDLGLWQGASHQDVDRDYPGQRSYWRHDPRWAPPQGESRLHVAERAAEVVKELMASDSFEHGVVVLVAHGGTIGALTAKLLDLPEEHYLVFSSLKNVQWSQLVARPRFVGEDDDMVHSAPAIDGSTVPLVPSSSENWWEDPRWLIEGWNMSAAQEDSHASIRNAYNAEEGGVE